MDSFSSFLGYLGLFASAIIVITSVVTAFNYKGKKGESYSPLNHFVSELGEVGVAAYAAVFNTGLIFSGLILVVFLGGLGYFINDFLGYVAAAVGVFTGFSCALVGALPMNNLKRHIPVALSFFNGGLVLTYYLRYPDINGPTGKAVIVDFSPYFSDDRKFCELLVFAKDT